ncbi:hypothetical protein MMC28_005934 [Mycoblastus sanguinarius]|nr:hypothetical protein [Mycoblastus sanguinarius]
MCTIIQWLVHILIIASTALAHGLEYLLPPHLEQPLGFGEADLARHPLFLLHRTLVNTESISGNEHDVGSYLESFLTDCNYTVERQIVESLPTTSAPAIKISADEKRTQRFNLLAYPGKKRQTRILLSSHLDTVPPFYGYDLRRDDEIWGRGSVDAKACVATQWQATQELLASTEISPDEVSLLFVVGEETGGDGMIRVNDLNMKWEAVIFGEPTELKLASGHKGILIFSLKAHGKAGHSGYPWLGKSANDMLVLALNALMEMKLPSSEKYGNSTLNIGQIQGGIAANVIAETAQAKIGIRIAEGSPEIVKKLVIDTVKAVDEEIELDFHRGCYGPVDIDSDVEGFDTMTVNYGTDIPNLKGSHKRYLYGPGSILVAHSDHEHLKADDMLTAVKGYKKLIRAALEKS